jgi:hypothetical protein
MELLSVRSGNDDNGKKDVHDTFLVTYGHVAELIDQSTRGKRMDLSESRVYPCEGAAKRLETHRHDQFYELMAGVVGDCWTNVLWSYKSDGERPTCPKLFNMDLELVQNKWARIHFPLILSEPENCQLQHGGPRNNSLLRRTVCIHGMQREQSHEKRRWG